jgi:hypothetical protein
MNIEIKTFFFLLISAEYCQIMFATSDSCIVSRSCCFSSGG